MTGMTPGTMRPPAEPDPFGPPPVEPFPMPEPAEPIIP